MTSDIRPFGAGEGVGFYWVRVEVQFGEGYCELVAIDEVGNVTTISAQRDFDAAAPTRGEAVILHLAPAIQRADGDLESRRAELPEPEEQPEPLSPATRRFLHSDDEPD